MLQLPTAMCDDLQCDLTCCNSGKSKLYLNVDVRVQDAKERNIKAGIRYMARQVHALANRIKNLQINVFAAKRY